MKTLRIFLFSILALIIITLFYFGLAPTGKITYIKDFKTNNYFIGKPTPEERTRLLNDGVQKIVGDPIYFTLHTLRPFEKARLTLTYKNDKANIIEAGVLADKQVWRYDLKPLENKTLNDYFVKWPSIRDGDLILFQRQPDSISFSPLKYESIDGFLSNLPNTNEIALYNYELKNEFSIPDYAPNNIENELGISLRGTYQFYTYIKNEDPYFVFSFSDINKNKDSDPIDINIYKDGGQVSNFHLDDLGQVSDNGMLEKRNDIIINPAKFSEGLYKFEIKTNDDIITDKIITKQHKIVFINRLWIADNSTEPITILSDSATINVQTINPGKLQTVKINNEDLKISETYRQFSFNTKNALNEIDLEKNDTILSGDGVFALSKSNYFNPNIKKIGLNFNDEGINFILAKYELPKSKDGWRIATAEFDLAKAYKEKEDSIIPSLNLLSKKYSFLLSIPGLKADDQIDDNILIKEIKIELEGKNIFEKIINSNYVQKFL